MSLENRLWEVFQEIDSSCDHRIEWNELRKCCEKLQIELDEEDKRLFHQCEVEKNHGMNFRGFQEFFKLRLGKIFDEIDVDRSGYINSDEIQKALQKININLSSRQIGSVLKNMDLDGNNKVDFNEFCTFFSDLPSPSFQKIAERWATGIGLDFGSDIAPTSVPPVEIPLFQFMLAGGLAGVASRTITAPLEKIKILAQTSSTKIRIISSFQNVINYEGFRGLFAGNLTNCVRIFPTSAIVCLVYSRMIKYTPVDNVKNPNQPFWRFLSGATAGVIATTATHPLDVVRARITIQTKSTAGKTYYDGIFGALRQIHIEEGVKGLYKGLSPSLISIAPFLGVQQCVYDVLKLFALNSKYGADPLTFLCCGALAGMVAQTTIHPLDVVRRQMQISRSDKGIAKSSLSAVTHLFKSGGISRVFAGLTASYLKVIPAAGSSLLVRDALLGRLKKD